MINVLVAIFGYILGGTVTSCFARYVENRLDPYPMGDTWYGIVTTLWPAFLLMYIIFLAIDSLARLTDRASRALERSDITFPNIVSAFGAIGRGMGSIFNKIGNLTGKVCPN